MVEWDARAVLGDEDEGWAARQLVGAESVQDALRQARLASAQLACQEHHIAHGRIFSHYTPDSARVVRSDGDDVSFYVGVGGQWYELLLRLWSIIP